LNGRSIKDPVRATIYSKEPFFVRVFNSASVSHYRLTFPFGLHIIGVDGQLVNPLWIAANQEIWVGAGQRIDLIARVPYLYGETTYSIFAFAENSLHKDYSMENAEFFLSAIVLYDPATFTGKNINSISPLDSYNWNATRDLSSKFQTSLEEQFSARDLTAVSRSENMQNLAPQAKTQSFVLSVDGSLGLKGFNNSLVAVPELMVRFGDLVFLELRNLASTALSFVISSICF
jgi:FtsP/CotA-like multicopper oxidase with cupredoxin domain